MEENMPLEYMKYDLRNSEKSQEAKIHNVSAKQECDREGVF